MSMFDHRFAPALAFAALALGGFVYAERVAHSDAVDLRDAQVASCERVNVLRATVADFLESAAVARRESGDHRVAREYREHLSNLQSVEHVIPGTHVIDCEAAFPSP